MGVRNCCADWCPGQDIQPDFSPDGNWIAFVSTRSSRTGMVQVSSLFSSEFRTFGGDIWVVPALGGQARLLARDGNSPAWNPGGTKVLYLSGPENHRSLMEVTTDGGAPRAVLPSESSSWEIVKARYSPNGRWITFETYDEYILILPADGGQPRQLTKGISHTWDPAGHRLYYCTSGFSGGTRLLSVEINDSAGKLKSNPNSAGLVTNLLRDLAISRDGHHVAATEVVSALNLTRLPLNPSGDAPAGPEELLTRGLVFDHATAVSPDNKSVAYASNRLGHQEIWLLHLDSERVERLQLPGRDLGEYGPAWFPDGSKLQLKRRLPDGKGSVWALSIDGSHAEELVASSDILMTNEGVPLSPDGRTLTYSMLRNGFYQLFIFDTQTRQSKQITFTRDDKYSVTWSPDRRWLVYSSNAGGAVGAVNLWKMLASGGAPEQMTKGNDRVRHMFYSPDGRWLYFQPNHKNLYRMPAAGGRGEQVTHFQEPTLFIEEPTISPEGRYLYYSRSNGASSLWLLTLETGTSESNP